MRSYTDYGIRPSLHRSHHRHRLKAFFYSLIIVFSVLAAIFITADLFIMPGHNLRAIFSRNDTSSEASQSETPSSSYEESSETTAPATTAPTSASLATESTANPDTILSEYDFSSPVPQLEAVDKSYFDDSVFIGDSITHAFLLYTGLSNAKSYAYNGLNVKSVFTKTFIDIDGETLSAVDALRKTQFSKVYLMFGINETGWNYSSVFVEKYGELIDTIKEINPDAKIYLQSVLPVTRKVNQSHDFIRKAKIDEYNSLILRLAASKEVYYLDCQAAIADSEGYLPDDAAADGIHPNKTYCLKLLDYIMCHAI